MNNIYLTTHQKPDTCSNEVISWLPSQMLEAAHAPPRFTLDSVHRCVPQHVIMSTYLDDNMAVSPHSYPHRPDTNLSPMSAQVDGHVKLARHVGSTKQAAWKYQSHKSYFIIILFTISLEQCCNLQASAFSTVGQWSVGPVPLANLVSLLHVSMLITSPTNRRRFINERFNTFWLFIIYVDDGLWMQQVLVKN